MLRNFLEICTVELSFINNLDLPQRCYIRETCFIVDNVFLYIVLYFVYGMLQDHVRGHHGNYGNEMADSLARAGAKK
jgi:hypothetical protein